MLTLRLERRKHLGEYEHLVAEVVVPLDVSPDETEETSAFIARLVASLEETVAKVKPFDPKDVPDSEKRFWDWKRDNEDATELPVLHFTSQNKPPEPFKGQVPAWVQPVAQAVPGVKEILTANRKDGNGRTWKANFSYQTPDGSWHNDWRYINDPAEKRERGGKAPESVPSEEPF